VSLLQKYFRLDLSRSGQIIRPHLQKWLRTEKDQDARYSVEGSDYLAGYFHFWPDNPATLKNGG
jgi:hypothetical protein